MKLKHDIAKYLLAAATLAPIPKNANAESEKYKLDQDNGYSFCAKAGLEVMIPSRTVENQLSRAARLDTILRNHKNS